MRVLRELLPEPNLVKWAKPYALQYVVVSTTPSLTVSFSVVLGRS